MTTAIRAARFADLTAGTLYALLRLRVDVFVVEQRCPYPDLDGRDTDPATVHLWTEDATGPAAYLRVLGATGDTGATGDAGDAGDPGDPGDGTVIRIGRVCTRADARGTGAAGRLLTHALERYGRHGAVLDAQAHLTGLYARYGFTPSGPAFDEDGIPHVPMRRPGQGAGDSRPGQDIPAHGS